MRTIEDAAIDHTLPLDRIQEVLQEHPVRVAILFGSQASGRAHARSDIDIAVEFEGIPQKEPKYNETFFRLSAELSQALETDAVDLVDLQTISPEFAETIFDQGILLVGDAKRVAQLQNQLSTTEQSDQSPRERLDATLAKIDEHLGGPAVTATDGETRDQ